MTLFAMQKKLEKKEKNQSLALNTLRDGFKPSFLMRYQYT